MPKNKGRGGKRRQQTPKKKKEKKIPPKPTITLWTPVPSSTGELDNELTMGVIKPPKEDDEEVKADSDGEGNEDKEERDVKDEKKDKAETKGEKDTDVEKEEYDPFSDPDALIIGLDSFGDSKAAYYVEQGDAVAYNLDKGGQVISGSLQLLNKAKVLSWTYNSEEKEWQGEVLYRGKPVKITEFDISKDIKDFANAFAPDDFVKFELNENEIIVAKTITKVKPNVAELPEERRKRVKAKFDEIIVGGLATQKCKEIETWKCPQCTSLNFSKIQDDIDVPEEKKPRSITCKNVSCGSARPLGAYAKVIKDEENNSEEYVFNSNAPWHWTLQDVGEWKSNEGHTTVGEVIKKAQDGYSANSVKDNCPGCGGKVGSGKGCTANIEDSKYPPLNFIQFYRLEEGTTLGNARRDQLKDLLDSYPPCNCGLLAIPKAPCNVFRRMKGHQQTENARANFENNKSLIKSEIVKERLMKTEGSILYPSISQIPADQSMLCHIVPIQANGCKSSPNNIVWRLEMCPLCQNLDKLFTEWQGTDI